MDGVVVFLKPPGMTSSNAVIDIRKLFGERRAGHLGTLDPAAAGVLPVCVGRAARLFPYLVDKEKRYLCEIAFGAATDTQDATGKVIARSDEVVDKQQLLDALPAFTGNILQKASAYSALKFNGRKLYDLALAGEEIPDKIRPITVSSMTLAERTGENRYLLDIVCSRGTYVRTLCHDIGAYVGVPAHMRFLLRTASGMFVQDRSYTILELAERQTAGELTQTLVSCEEALAFLPQAALAKDRVQPVKNGLSSHVPGLADGDVRVYGAGEFLGVGCVAGEQVKLKVHLYGNEAE